MTPGNRSDTIITIRYTWSRGASIISRSLDTVRSGGRRPKGRLPKNVSALRIGFWACSEELYDCHRKMESYAYNYSNYVELQVGSQAGLFLCREKEINRRNELCQFLKVQVLH